MDPLGDNYLRLQPPMHLISLGRTQLVVPQLGFGALPIQRVDLPEATRLLRAAFAAGVRYFDTARAYSDSEEKIGKALSDVRSQIIIATKTAATDAAGARRDLETSLAKLRTGYIDIIQLHNPEKVPRPDDEGSAYSALRAARQQGLVRFIGITNHRAAVAREAVSSGLFDTLQFPLSHISTPEDQSLVDHCRQHGVGFIAMKALCGGLLTNVTVAFAFFRQQRDVLPIWGIQHEHELAQFVELERNPPEMTDALTAAIEHDRNDLAASFCRGCGYCLPCAAEIPIPMAARMAFLLRRAPYRQFLSDDWKSKMRRISNCTDCKSCVAKCPYGLDTPALLKTMLADYEQFALDHGA